MATQSEETRMALLAQDLKYVKNAVDKIDMKVSSSYVSKEEFDPIKKIVYGMVSLILIGVLGAALSIVIQ